MKYERIFAAKPCVKCGEMISAPTGGMQRFCEPCGTACSVEGCTNAIRAKGFCSAHTGVRHEVPIFAPINDLCGIDGCGRPHRQKGICELHYRRIYKTGSPGVAAAEKRVARGQPCLVDGCEKLSVGRGYCGTHYARLRTRGDAGKAELERREQGEGSITESGYRKIKTPNGYEFEHRLNMAKELGRSLREGENVHHRDGDRLNNDPSNLELWVVQQPAGQRLEDRIDAAKALLTRYGINHEVFGQNSMSSGLLSFGA